MSSNNNEADSFDEMFDDMRSAGKKKDQGSSKKDTAPKSEPKTDGSKTKKLEAEINDLKSEIQQIKQQMEKLSATSTTKNITIPDHIIDYWTMLYRSNAKRFPVNTPLRDILEKMNAWFTGDKDPKKETRS